MIALAWALRDLHPDTVERYVVDEQLISFNGEGGNCSGAEDYWAECINPDTLHTLVQQWLGSLQ
jgi:hypothetical protein